VDQLVLEGIVDLDAQAANGHFHHVGIAVEVHVPDLGNDLGAGQDLAGAAHQQMQQGELLGGQVYAPAPR
jgi:hypothetical protein